jgi:hypothetical protein
MCCLELGLFRGEVRVRDAPLIATRSWGYDPESACTGV